MQTVVGMIVLIVVLAWVLSAIIGSGIFAYEHGGMWGLFFWMALFTNPLGWFLTFTFGPIVLWVKCTK